MGLGKTAQLITYLGALSKLEKDKGPHLVVVPASLLENWQRELRRWCPNMKSVVYYGKYRSIIRKRLIDLKKDLENGKEVNDDLADLQDPDILAEVAASEKRAREARKMDNSEEEESDYDDLRESDEEYDTRYDPDEAFIKKRPFQKLPAKIRHGSSITSSTIRCHVDFIHFI